VKQVSLEAKEINMKPFRGSKKLKPPLDKKETGVLTFNLFLAAKRD
jgi:hypothetical protein